ncbi:MAG: amine dehydrogenase [Sphingomonadales bacterium]|nr:amine dehydrogenase [Sphingomonadales bacterium]
MGRQSYGAIASAALLASVFAGPARADQKYPAPLAAEQTPATATLSDSYPASYLYVQDMHGPSLLDSRAAIVDVAADAHALKGQFQVAQFATFVPSTIKSEIYVAETYYPRLTRGERTDVLTIWDKKTLTPKGEIVLPGGKRGQFVTQRQALQLTNDEKWALVFNFTPASSVTVVDLDARKVLGDIDLPGCSLIYPTGPRGFMSLCADGTMTSIALDAAGKLASTVTSKAFNDIDHDPMFMTPAMVGKTAWFATFRGGFRAIDLSAPVARDLGGFSLPPEKTPAGEWRPGGWQVITAAPDGKLYMLMNPAGKEGSHKDGGTEVWVVDPAKKARVARIVLRHPGGSIEVTRETRPSLVVALPDGSLDVYDAGTGSFGHTIPEVVMDPTMLTASR